MSSATVVILGAGINGAALARELICQRVAVTLVDTHDISGGATAYSSRLIHGGLRYLEYGEFALVRESLEERERLLHQASAWVKPLRLYVPVRSRLSGLIPSGMKFLGLERWAPRHRERGLWLVQCGLMLYDYLARSSQLPRHRTHRVGALTPLPIVDPRRSRWLCEYFDAQVRYPERFVVALLADARREAERTGTPLAVHTYARARLDGQRVIIDRNDGVELAQLEPSAVINATGAWVDRTLEQLLPRDSSETPLSPRGTGAGGERVPAAPQAPRLMAPTKGSHLVLNSERLQQRLNGSGLYAEADDGRPVFILPLGPVQLIGTTDLPYDGDPRDAVATDDEIDYLLSTVNRYLADPSGSIVSRDDLLYHYSGVRPLPAAHTSSTAAVTRRHWIHEHTDAPLPLVSLIGGKLTTCRALAEQTADLLLARLKLPRLTSTRERPLSTDSVPDRVMAERASPPPDPIVGTSLSRRVVMEVIRHEWVSTLDDLVERRLMLLDEPRLSRASLVELARLLVEHGKLAESAIDHTVDATIERIAKHYGRKLS